MFKYVIFCILYISINNAIAGDLPNSLFQIEIGKSIQEIKNSSKAGRMSGVYLIQTDEKQLIEPLSRLIVKVNKKSDRVEQIIGEAVISEKSCASETKRLKEKYEKLFSLPFEKYERTGTGDVFYIANKNTRLFSIGCDIMKKNTTLSVSLADSSNELSILNKKVNTSVSKVVDSPRKTLSLWSTDCENIENNRWFTLESHGEKKYMFIFCAGFKCIPLPGFGRKPFDVYNDKRIKWVSKTEMKLSSKHKHAGWEGYITFNRCHKY